MKIIPPIIILSTTLILCFPKTHQSLFIQALNEQSVVEQFGHNDIKQLELSIENPIKVQRIFSKLGNNIKNESEKNRYYNLLGLYHYEILNNKEKGKIYFYLGDINETPLFNDPAKNNKIIHLNDGQLATLPPDKLIESLFESMYPDNPTVYLTRCMYAAENCEKVRRDINYYQGLFKKHKNLLVWLKRVNDQKPLNWVDIYQEEETSNDVSSRPKIKQKKSKAAKDEVAKKSLLNQHLNHQTAISNCHRITYTKQQHDFNRKAKNSLLNTKNNIDPEDAYLNEQQTITLNHLKTLLDRYDILHSTLRDGIISEIPYNYRQKRDYKINCSRDGSDGQDFIINLKIWGRTKSQNNLDLVKFTRILERLNYEVKAYRKLTNGQTDKITQDIRIRYVLGKRFNNQSLKILPSSKRIKKNHFSNFLNKTVIDLLLNQPFKGRISMDKNCSKTETDQGENYLILSCQIKYKNLFLHELKRINKKMNKLNYINNNGIN